VSEEGPRLFGILLPSISSVVWATVIASVGAYFIYGRAAANVVAIVGAVVVTAVVVKTERSK
jgi:hypothetical protein